MERCTSACGCRLLVEIFFLFDMLLFNLLFKTLMHTCRFTLPFINFDFTDDLNFSVTDALLDSFPSPFGEQVKHFESVMAFCRIKEVLCCDYKQMWF